MPTARRLVLALAAMLLALVVAELGLRALAPATDRWCLWPPHLDQLSEPLADVYPGVTGPSRFRVNSLGLRADELVPGADPVVLAVGGSTTECLVLDQSEAWPRRLQDLLSTGGARAWVGNAGRSGHSTREHVFQVPALLDTVPDTDVLLVLAGANDLGLRLKQDADHDPHVLERDDAAAVVIPRAFALHPPAYASHLPWYKRTELYARARDAKNRLASRGGAGTEIGPRGQGVARWRDNRAHATELRDALPDLRPALDEYRRNLTRLVRAAQERGVAVVLMTQPSLWRDDLDERERALLWWGGVGDFQAPGARVPFYTASALARGIDAYNAVLLEVAAATGAEALDLAAAIPRDTSMFFDDMHFTEAGAARVAQVVAAGLAGLAPPPR